MTKIEKFLQVAQEAIKQYGLDVVNIEYLCEETNMFFTVYTTNKLYVLKIFQEESSKLEDNLLEVFMLNEVSTKTDIIVPSVFFSKANEPIVFCEDIDGNIKRIALYDYLEGTDFDGLETKENVFELGKIVGKMHKASQTFVLPNTMDPKKWDQVFYYRDEEVLYNKEPYRTFYEEEDILLLDQLIPYVNGKLKEYYKDSVFLIHADLNPWNVKLHEGAIRLFDFEEGMVGSFLHELAIFLFYYKYDSRNVYHEFKEAFIKGYEEVLEVPEYDEFDIELLMLARRLNFINYILMINDNPKDYIRLNMKRIKDVLKQYNLDFPLK